MTNMDKASASSQTGDSPSEAAPGSSAVQLPRRSFLYRAVTLAVGGIVSLIPVVIGIVFFFDPLRRRGRRVPSQQESPVDENGYVRVAHVDALPDDRTPRMFQVIADRIDAWNYFSKRPIGAVYLHKTGTDDGDEKIAAFNVICPHLGCAVDFRPDRNAYLCPCHNSEFTIDGVRSETSPSARDLDPLDVFERDGEIFVKYEEFRSGIAERVSDS